jgi:hypothetical protein
MCAEMLLRVYLGQIFSVPHDRNGSKSAVAPTAAHCRFTFNCGRTVALPIRRYGARIEVIDSRRAALS